MGFWSKVDKLLGAFETLDAGHEWGKLFADLNSKNIIYQIYDGGDCRSIGQLKRKMKKQGVKVNYHEHLYNLEDREWLISVHVSYEREFKEYCRKHGVRYSVIKGSV